jgi:hypothetical protein
MISPHSMDVIDWVVAIISALRPIGVIAVEREA